MRRLIPALGEDTLIHTPYGATEALPVATTHSHEILGETAAQTNLGKGVCIGRPVEGLTARIIPVSDQPISIESGGQRPWLPEDEYGEIAVSERMSQSNMIATKRRRAGLSLKMSTAACFIAWETSATLTMPGGFGSADE